MDEAFTPALSLTLEGVTDMVGGVPVDGYTVADKVIVAVKGPMLVRVRFEKAAVPGWMTS
jgi:hypothetical protein